MPLTRRSSIVTTLLLGVALPVATASLAFTLPLDAAWGQAMTARPGPSDVVVVNAEVMVLLATQVPGGGSIDPAIGNLPQLRKPPLSAYNSYHLLDKRTIPLEVGRGGTYTLVNGRVLQVTFVEPTADHGFHLKAAITQPGKSAYLKLLELTAKANEPFFVAGQTFTGGNLILAITLRR